MKRIAVLGSTGSIGCQTLDVARWHPDEIEIVALVASRLSESIEAQAREFRPRTLWLTRERAAPELGIPGVGVVVGEEHLAELATQSDVDMLVVATSGTVGFKPTLAALAAGKPVALANKETLIMAGHLVTEAARQTGAPLLAIDSEHSAIWQCLRGEEPYDASVRRLILTASGGAFRDRPIDGLSMATPEEALRHPTWSMGPKITVDSATLMNKGLEVIEAHWLFGLPYSQIDAVIHHQSVIHSLVEFVDGSVKAQLGVPDMRLPIQYALLYPKRFPTQTAALDLTAQGSLTFAQVDEQRYPCFTLARQAGEVGGSYPTVLNAANEVAVERFLAGDLPYGAISSLLADALAAHVGIQRPDLAEVERADAWARELARGWPV